MRERTRKARLNKLLLEESQRAETWWWLSFCDPDKPKGHQFLGAILTRARGIASAITKTHQMGINPGGEVQGAAIPDEIAERADCPFKFEDHSDRLLSREHIDKHMSGTARMP